MRPVRVTTTPFPTSPSPTLSLPQDYPNIYDLVQELGIPEREVFTPYTTSAFWSPEGLEATAPVFADAPVQLPSPMGQARMRTGDLRARLTVVHTSHAMRCREPGRVLILSQPAAPAHINSPHAPILIAHRTSWIAGPRAP